MIDNSVDQCIVQIENISKKFCLKESDIFNVCAAATALYPYIRVHGSLSLSHTRTHSGEGGIHISNGFFFNSLFLTLAPTHTHTRTHTNGTAAST